MTDEDGACLPCRDSEEGRGVEINDAMDEIIAAAASGDSAFLLLEVAETSDATAELTVAASSGRKAFLLPPPLEDDVGGFRLAVGPGPPPRAAEAYANDSW